MKLYLDIQNSFVVEYAIVSPLLVTALPTATISEASEATSPPMSIILVQNLIEPSLHDSSAVPLNYPDVLKTTSTDTLSPLST